ncbi:hypothetical protein [Edaphovirga cremea]|uniref:hypothetical protein n=1 Tax=Edaphovirga cremea TaxID=2267246 RepID=UPI003989A48B
MATTRPTPAVGYASAFTVGDKAADAKDATLFAVAHAMSDCVLFTTFDISVFREFPVALITPFRLVPSDKG